MRFWWFYPLWRTGEGNVKDSPSHLAHCQSDVWMALWRSKAKKQKNTFIGKTYGRVCAIFPFFNSMCIAGKRKKDTESCKILPDMSGINPKQPKVTLTGSAPLYICTEKQNIMKKQQPHTPNWRKIDRKTKRNRFIWIEDSRNSWMHKSYKNNKKYRKQNRLHNSGFISGYKLYWHHRNSKNYDTLSQPICIQENNR